MPLASRLMFKYSDVLSDSLLGNGERDPKNYHEQLLRCGDDTGLNVLATVNNRFVLDKLSTADHHTLEQEFLSNSIRTKLARLRHRRQGDEPDSVLFTRVGALLNLKTMLGLTRPSSGFKRTAIGACALHANDYAESFKTAALTKGLLPVVTEFAPVWDLQNPSKAGPLLRRFYFIYRKLLGADAGMKAIISEELKCAVEEVDFAGLPFESYFALLFGIYAVVSHGAQARPFPTSILDLHDVAAKVQVPQWQLTKFISERAMTESEAFSLIGSLDDAAVFSARVADSGWSSDFRLFRNRPLLELKDGRFLVLDLQFIFESASRGLYWSLFQRLSSKAQNRFTEKWGGLFETYVQRLLSHYFPNVRLNVVFDGGEVDVLLQIGDALFVIEVKSGFLPQEAKGSRDTETFSKAVEKKFVRNEKGNPKGVGQLARAIDSIRNGRVPGTSSTHRLYPVLIGEDPVLQTFAMNAYLDRIFTEQMTSGGETARLTVMTVDELETILPYVGAEDVSFGELFDARLSDQKLSAEPVNSTFYSFAMRRKFTTRPETFLSVQGDELTAILDREYAELRSNT